MVHELYVSRKRKKKHKADGVGGLSLDANPHIRLRLRQNGSVEFAVFPSLLNTFLFRYPSG